MLRALEEHRERRRLSRELNVLRDQLARRWAVPWVVIIHPMALLDLEQEAPDFCDFVGLWLRNEAVTDDVIDLDEAHDADAHRHARGSTAIQDAMGDQQDIAISLAILGRLEFIEGRRDEGRRLVREAINILEKIQSSDLAQTRELLMAMSRDWKRER